MNGIELIAAERERQITKDGWPPEHDDRHDIGEMKDAAICYLFANEFLTPANAPVNDAYWPWPASWWTPSDDPIRNLVKAGALIAAEIDRLQRAAPAELPGQEPR